MKKTDPTIELIRNVYKQNVPLQEELSNPFSANKRRNKKSAPKLLIRSSSPIEEWDARVFVRYFADEYKREYQNKSCMGQRDPAGAFCF